MIFPRLLLWLLFGTRRMFKLASFYTGIWHRNYAIIFSMLILGSTLFHNVCVAFSQRGIKGRGAASRTGRGTHEKPAVTLKINGSGELSSSSRRVSPISFTFTATMGLLMVVFQSALSQRWRVSAFLCFFTHDSKSESHRASSELTLVIS